MSSNHVVTAPGCIAWGRGQAGRGGRTKTRLPLAFLLVVAVVVVGWGAEETQC